MKFKQKQVQNQRIERITIHHLVIGIDIAKEVHVARAVDFRGIELGSHCTFSNELDGFEKLLHWVTCLQRLHSKTTAILGMEPTGHYWLNLANDLLEKSFEVVVTNPYQVSRNKENRDNSPTKNDVKDALVIADMVKNGYYAELRLPSCEYEALRILVDSRDFLTNQCVSVQNRIHRWLDLYFPEYSKVFKDWTCKTSIVTLRLFPLPSEIQQMQPKEVLAQWKKHMKRSAGLSYAQALVEQAHRSVAKSQALVEAKLSLEILLEQYEKLAARLEELEQKMTSHLEQLPLGRQLLAIKGLGPIHTCSLLADTGDLGLYHHGNQVLRLAGLHIGERSSGQYKGQIKITKRGRSRLRKTLYLAVLSLIVNDASFRAQHHQNVKIKKMAGLKSIIKLCGKLARILVAMARNNEAYRPEQIGSVEKVAA